MSDSDARLGSTNTAIDPSLTDREHPYIPQEYTDLLDRLFAVGQVEMRWLAGDALVFLSLIAEYELPPPDGSNQAAWTMREYAVRAIRKARAHAEQSIAREAAV